MLNLTTIDHLTSFWYWPSLFLASYMCFISIRGLLFGQTDEYARWIEVLAYTLTGSGAFTILWSMIHFGRYLGKF